MWRPPALPLITLASLLSTAGAAEYVNPQYQLTFTPPAGWSQGQVPGTLVVFMKPKRVGGFSPNLNLVVQDIPPKMTLNQYTELSRQQMRQLFTDGKVLRTRKLKLAGLAAQELTSTGRQGIYKLHFTSVYALKNRKAYLITGTTVQGHEQEMAKVMEKVVKSFQWRR